MQQALIYMKKIQTMNSHNQGLTVGELTITVGIMIIAVLIWSNLAKRETQKQSFNNISIPVNLINTSTQTES